MGLSSRATPVRRAALALAVGLGLGLGVGLGIAGPAQAQTTPQARGHALVLANCSRCHAVETTGASPNPQAPPFRRLHERFPVENLAEALVEGLRVSHTPMPQFQFSEQDAGDIIAYLQSIQTAASPSPK